MTYEIRIYNDCSNMDWDYYTGDEDIKLREFADTPAKLKSAWRRLLKKNEGCTYSVWDHLYEDVIVGGVFDPTDIDVIKEHFS